MLRLMNVGKLLTLLFVAPALALVADGSATGSVPIMPGDVAAPVTTLADWSVVTLNITADAGESFTVEFPVEGETFTVDLVPHSIRAAGYQVRVQIEDGSYVDWDTGVEKTMRGVVREYKGSQVAGSLLDTGLEAKIVLPDERVYWIEPAEKFLAGSGAFEYVIYRDTDVMCSGGSCGTDELIVDSDSEDGIGGPRGAACGTGLCVAEMACDADFEYFQDWGSVTGVQDRIESVTNTMNLQYERDVDITHVITTIIVRSAEPDPYTSSNYNTLLNQFRDHWLASQGGVVRDLAQLFTGKTLTPGGVIGVAYTIGGICTTSAYCLVQSDFSATFACVTDLSAHECGHLWAADHCTCNGYTMNSFITCANLFHPTFDFAQIESHRDSRTCLGDAAPPTEPPNNACANALTILNGVTAFDTTGATTDGPTLPGSCDEGSGLSFLNDIWYNYTATCTGDLTVSTCNDATFDTRLAIYSGTGCPAGTLVACNDDGTGCSNFSSFMTAAVTAGSTYKIRVGGFDSVTGTGDLTLTCTANQGDPVIQMVFYNSLTVPDGIGTAQNEDIVTFDPNTGLFSAFYFDGSDVGLTNFTVDAIAFLSTGDILVSLAQDGNLTGLVGGPNGTLVDDCDIVQFTPTSLGSTTAGTWTFYFDGSDVGLTTDDEDIDALSITPDGRLAISTTGIPTVTGLTGLNDEDLIAFTATSLGSVTAGTWAYYFDGGDVNVGPSNSEDVDAVSISPTEVISLSTVDLFSVTGVSGADEDLFNFTPTTLGSTTAGTFTAFFDGSVEGVGSGDIGAAELDD